MEIIIDAVKKVSGVGSSPVLLMLAISVLTYFYIRRDYLRVFFVTLSLCSGLCSSILKGWFGRERPIGYISEGFIKWERFLRSEVHSFPSTHVILYTVFFGYLLYLSYNVKGVDKVIRHIIRVFSAVMIIFVGGSRVLLGAHHVWDAVAGYFFGVAYLGLLIMAEKFLAQRQLSKQSKRKER